ncbi:RNA polymerase sigma-I factor [Bacillus solimangrovi]|uniref:RNA polymerase sigma factor SigI n=1 Tax=Bacillus solimangrovi TaxID=1305675 RepID=A0A1E5LDV9_9BACI|nr:RNA polymerase sigma-I factor [Bacillus solimangrovi]OEH92278.1 RNA polymerase sigma-I factor [Bacillus solimangrovi]
MFPFLFISWIPKKNDSNINVEELVFEAQKGNDEIRNDLLEKYQPFIKKVISKVCQRYISESMDEYSVGLLAFNEAIDQYQANQGSKFLTFANMVIRRRVIDYIRKEQRHRQHYAWDYEENDKDVQYEESYIEQRTSIENYELKKQQEERLEQIMEYRDLLATFKISFDTLSKQCPKHWDARENAKQIAKLIAEDPEFVEYLMTKKRLPIRHLEKKVSCSRKTIERNRKYIIAVSLIHIGGFEALQSYIEPQKGGE